MGNYQTPDDLLRNIRKISNRVESLEKSNPLNNGTIDDGGLTIKAGGAVTWYDENENIRFQLALGELLNLQYFTDEGFAAVRIGEAINSLIDPGDGIRILSAVGSGAVIATMTQMGVFFGRNDGEGILSARENINNYIKLVRNDKRGIFLLSETDANNSFIQGGAIGEQDNGDAYSFCSAMKFMGDSAGPIIECRNAADTAYIPIRASAFNVSSAKELKDVIGKNEEGALATVIDVPIHKWKYKEKDQKAKHVVKEDGSTEITTAPIEGFEEPVRIGPFADDMPDELVSPPTREGDGATIDLAGAVWTLWQAVQEQNKIINDLKEEIADLKDKK